MLQHRAAMLPEAAHPAQDEPAPLCRITAGATPVVTSPTDESMQYLYDQLGLTHANVVDRHDVSDGLHRLGESLMCCLQQRPCTEDFHACIWQGDDQSRLSQA